MRKQCESLCEMSVQSEMRTSENGRERNSFSAEGKGKGRLQIDVQAEGGAANGIDGRDFK